MNQPIKSFSFKSGLRTELEIIPISYLFSEHRESIALPHRAEFYHVFWFTKGNPVHTVDFIPIALKPDSLLFVRKNRVQFFDQSGYYEGWILLFTDTFFNRTPLDRQFLTSTILFHDLLSIPTLDMSLTETDLTLLLTQIQQELSQPEAPFQADVLHNFLHNLLLYSDRERRRQDFQPFAKGPDLDYTRAFEQLLENQFQNLRSVQVYATQMGITERRLQQATAAILGKTPKQLIDERVVLEAKRLLAYSSQSVKEIGFSLGFDEPTNFIRFFRRQQQQTPADFKQSLWR